MTEPQHPDSRPALPLWQLVTLSIYWFGIVIIWGGLNKIILPAMIADQPGGAANLGVLLAILVTVGVIAPIVIQPTVGMISDYTVTRWGRRKPYIFVGALLDVVFLFGIATSQTYLALVAFYFLLQLSSNFAQGPFQGYVPDLVPKKQVGLASGLMGTMIVLGTIAGVGIATFGVNSGNLFLATLALGVVEVVDDARARHHRPRGHRGARSAPQSWLGVARSAWATDILRESSVLWLLARPPPLPRRVRRDLAGAAVLPARPRHERGRCEHDRLHRHRHRRRDDRDLGDPRRPDQSTGWAASR